MHGRNLRGDGVCIHPNKLLNTLLYIHTYIYIYRERENDIGSIRDHSYNRTKLGTVNSR